MVKSILVFEEVGQVGLADYWLVQHPKSRLLRPSAKYDDPSIFLGRLDNRNMKVM